MKLTSNYHYHTISAEREEILDSLEKAARKLQKKRKTIDKVRKEDRRLCRKRRGGCKTAGKMAAGKGRSAQKAIRSFLKSVMSCLARSVFWTKMLPTEDSGRKDRREPGSKDFLYVGRIRDHSE